MSTLAHKPAPIVMYTRERYCPDVERARAVLNDYGLSWTEFNVEADADALARMQALTNRSNVPTVVIGSEILVEPTKDEIVAVLIRAGIPCNQRDECAAENR